MSNTTEKENNHPELPELFGPLYRDLKNIAECHMRRENAGHTLQATALVNEAYIRLMSARNQVQWADQKHFLCTAAEVMRHILVDSARSKNSLKRGGDYQRVELEEDTFSISGTDYDVISIHEALVKFETIEPKKANVIKLRYFAGLTIEEVADALDISRASANNYWNFGKAWLLRELSR